MSVSGRRLACLVPAGVVAATDSEAVVATVQVMAEQPEEETTEASDAEPEVIGRPAKQEDED